MSVRPLTIALLVVLLLVTASYALFHFGVLDPFLSGYSEVSDKNDNTGPVVRHPVSNLVLPLPSSKQQVAQSVNGSSEVGAETETEAGTDVVTEVQNAGDTQPVQVSAVKKVAAIAVTEVAQKDVAPKKSKVEKVVAGTLSRVKLDCSSDSLTLKISLSQPSDRITWFNLNDPKKLIVDIRGHWKNYAKSIYRLKDCAVEKIVLGENSDRFRLVFYINKKDLPLRIRPAIKKLSDGIEIKIKL
ncbi:AMIN domain-containing protein [Maridesulfovibrio ferrireducens]|uniref:AMIN domain-containing protein n=1 Tax=Maridesulfovibrio ferrireducens TaxID=246191 RepID=A0A1G9D638_9BACT|nr:AMIN domain-containing protein [Maridesulfovibrio ferrireducens]SDK59283.1 AMIN domain-containing protein [Maridesulfovibrio ferrireducens]